MGLMDLFGRKSPATGPGGVEEPSAVDYVEWLVQHMLSTSCMELAIATNQALPGSVRSQADAAPPPCLPDARVVINRLKILSGVNPIRQAKVVEGAFERPRLHHAIVVTTRFQDEGEQSTCSLRLRIRCRNA